MKRLASLLLLACAVASAQQTTTGRFGQINLYTGDPSGAACSAGTVVHSTTRGICSCANGAYACSSAAGISGTVQATNGSGSLIATSTVYVAPSGDTTGATDTTKLQAAITAAQSSGNAIQLGTGNYYINALTIGAPITLRGVGIGTVLNYCATTGNPFTISYNNATNGNTFNATQLLLSDFVLQMKSGVTPTAGYGMSFSNGGSNYLVNAHVQNISFQGLWQPMLFGTGLINNWITNNAFSNCLSGNGMEFNTPTPGGDYFVDSDTLTSSSPSTPCSLQIDQSDVMEFTNLKLNSGAYVKFTQAASTNYVRFINPSIEGLNNSTGCGIDFAANSGFVHPPTGIQIVGGQIDLWQYAFCHAGAAFAPLFNFDEHSTSQVSGGTSVFRNNQFPNTNYFYDYDQFLGASVALTSHLTQMNQAWNSYTGSGDPANANLTIDGNGNLKNTNATIGNFGSAYTAALPSGTNYSVSVTCTSQTTNAGSTLAAIYGRLTTGANTQYLLQWNNNALSLYRVNASTPTQLGVNFSLSTAAGNSHTFTLAMNSGGALEAYVDGVSAIVATDGSPLTSGPAGLRLSGATSMLCTNFQVSYPVN